MDGKWACRRINILLVSQNGRAGALIYFLYPKSPPTTFFWLFIYFFILFLKYFYNLALALGIVF